MSLRYVEHPTEEMVLAAVRQAPVASTQEHLLAICAEVVLTDPIAARRMFLGDDVAFEAFVKKVTHNENSFVYYLVLSQ